jgi:ABC-type lipoprotein export system ATPase subunit
MSETRGRSDETAIRATQLVKVYENERIAAVDHVDLTIASGESVAVMGPSGCGKSTVLNLIAALDRPDSGELIVFGSDLSRLSRRQADEFRRVTVGFVFQLHNLLPHLTAHENVQAPMIRAEISPRERCRRASVLLERVGLVDRMTSLPPTLSGGERQRVAVARALANRPRLILADEPTGALDSKSGGQILELLQSIQADEQVTLMIVTHDGDVAASASRVIRMHDGRIMSD